MRFVFLTLRGAGVLAAALLSPLAAAQAPSAILVWPIDPVIEQDERAAALWIENRGRQPAVLQLRIFAWSQVDGADRYAEQDDIVGTPPMIRIAPGARQLIRLTRIHATPPGTEQAFRVIIDEIPMPQTAAASAAPSVGIRFQLRYSIPLFAYGEGLWRKPAPDRRRDPQTAGRPQLSWRVTGSDGERQLEIRNTGSVHARLTGVSFRQGGESAGIADGLFGYVLAGSTLRRPLPAGIRAAGALHATVNGGGVPQPLLASQ